MDLALTTTEHEGVAVLSAAGEVDLATAPRLHDGLVRLAAQHAGEAVVVDLDGVATLDDAGVGVLLGGRRRIRSAGGELHLVVSDPRLLRLLTDSGVAGLVPIHATLTAALGVIRHGP